jgi:hypothetical protein
VSYSASQLSVNGLKLGGVPYENVSQIGHMNLLKDSREMNLYNNSNIVHVECLKSCFMDVVQSVLKSIMTLWNCHNIRKQRNYELLTGKPDVMYFVPQIFCSPSCKIAIVKNDTERCRQMFGKPCSEFTYSITSLPRHHPFSAVFWREA